MDLQPSNSDDNYDENGDVIDPTMLPTSKRARILERRSVIRSDEENCFLGNDIEEEVDNSFEAKRKALIVHFHKAYDKGEVQWPRGMNEDVKLRAK